MARYRQIDYYKNDGTGTLLHYDSDSGLAQKPIDYISQVGKFWGEVLPYNWTRTGYVFVEWNTAADGSGDSYYGGEDTPKVYTTLYAIWSLYNETQVSQGVINLIHQNQYESIAPASDEFYLIKDGKEFEITDKLTNIWNPMVPRPVAPLYQLPEAKTFTGNTSQCINTGVKLCDTDKDFTLFVDFAYSSNSSYMTVVHCMIETSPYNRGVCIYYYSSDNAILGLYYQATKGNTYNTARHKVVFRHRAGTSTSCDYFYDNNAMQTFSGSSYTFTSKNTYLGCRLTDSGGLDRLFKGTIYDACIYDKVLPDKEVSQLMTNGSKAFTFYEYVPLSEYPEYDVNLYPSAKLVQDAYTNNIFNADTKHY